LSLGGFLANEAIRERPRAVPQKWSPERVSISVDTKRWANPSFTPKLTKRYPSNRDKPAPHAARPKGRE
jgi:hypothetical protein